MERISQNIPYISLFLENKRSYGTNQCVESEKDKDSGAPETVQLMEEKKVNRETADSPKISSLQACWNISNLIQGAGTLGIPFAVLQGSYLSLAAVALIGLLSNYTGKLIIDCLYETPFVEQRMGGSRLRNSYALIGQASWGKHGARAVYAVQLLQVTSTGVLYLLLVADTFNNLFKSQVVSYCAWIVISGCLLLPFVFLEHLKHVSWLSMFSVFAFGVVFVFVVGYGLIHAYDWHFDFDVTKLKGFPVAWGIILFSFECHPFLPSIEEKMENPEHFNICINCSFLVSTVIKLLYGLIAVLTFKNDTKQQISENLPTGILQNTANCLLGLNGLLSFALPLFAVMTIIRKAQFPCLSSCFPDEEQPLTIKERGIIYLMRLLFIVLSTVVAFALPQFSLFMAVIGSISGVLITLLFPCLFHIILHYNYISRSRYVLNVLIVCVGLLSGVVGLVFSIRAFVKP